MPVIFSLEEKKEKNENNSAESKIVFLMKDILWFIF